MEALLEENQVYQFFLWSVLLKAAISLAEIAAGILFFFVTPEALISWTSMVAQNMVPEVLRGYALSAIASVGSELFVISALFIALYLISRGLIKCILIFAMLRNVLWAYPASLAVIGIFVLYQLYQIATTQSVLIVLITLFDLVVMYFIWKEYTLIKRRG